MRKIISFANFARIDLCGFSSWYTAWLRFSLRLLAKFEVPARISNKTCLKPSSYQKINVNSLLPQ